MEKVTKVSMLIEYLEVLKDLLQLQRTSQLEGTIAEVINELNKELLNN